MRVDRFYKSEQGDPFILSRLILTELARINPRTKAEAQEIVEGIMETWERVYLEVYERRKIDGRPENIGWCG
jgi:hypothetical protein